MKFSPITLLAFASIIALSSGTSKVLEWKEMTSACYKLLRTSPEARDRHGQDQFSLDPEAHCVTRCVGIITGLYDDETGIRMEQLATWSGNGEPGAVRQEFKLLYQACVGMITPEQYGDDYCTKSSKHFECILKSGMFLVSHQKNK